MKLKNFFKRVAAVALGIAAIGCVQTAPVRAAETTDQLKRLTEWYTAMDPDKGYIDLLRDDLSLLIHDTDTTNWINYPTIRNSVGPTRTWQVNSQIAGDYAVRVVMQSQPGKTVRVRCGDSTAEYTFNDAGYHARYEVGTVAVPKGRGEITVEMADGSNLGNLYSLELIPADRKADYDRRVKAREADTSWMSENPVGAMFQWGEWGAYKDEQGNVVDNEGFDCYEKVDWDAFAKNLKDHHVGFVVWSICWNSYYIPAPIQAVKDIYPDHAADKDYLREILNACEKYGIEVILYYHAGWNDTRNDGDDWWDRTYLNQIPEDSQGRPNHERKEKFMNDWLNIIREIGERYGSRFKGWMFDHTSSYGCAPYEMLADACKAGYANRAISFNSPSPFASFTDFEDFYFGEVYNGNITDIAPVDQNGIYTEGPYAGEQAYNCFAANIGGWSGWGFSKYPDAMKDWRIEERYTQEQYDDIVATAFNTRQCMAFNFLMWADGTYSEESLNRFKNAVENYETNKERDKTVIDADDTLKARNSWESVDSSECIGGSYKKTTAAHDYMELKYKGYGLEVVAQKGSDAGQVDIYLDNKYYTTIDLSARTEEMTVCGSVFTTGANEHILRLVNREDKALCVDGFYIYNTYVQPADPNVPQIAEEDAAVYTGERWHDVTGNPSFHGNGAKDAYGGTIYPDSRGEATAELAFYGTGVEVYSCKGASEGKFKAYIDGKLVGEYDNKADQYIFDQLVFSKKDLEEGSHKLKIEVVLDDTLDQQYLKIDYFKVYGGTVEEPARDFDDSKYYMLESLSMPGKVLGTTGVKSTNEHHTDVVIQERKGNDALQAFRFVDVGGGYYKVGFPTSNTLFWDAWAGSSTNYSVGLYEFLGNYPTQMFKPVKVEKDGKVYFKIVMKSDPGWCVENHSAEDAAVPVRVAEYTGANNQLWKLTETTPAMDSNKSLELLSLDTETIELALDGSYQMKVMAQFDLGAAEDYTTKCVYTAADPAIVSIDKGKIVPLAIGETTVTVSYMGVKTAAMVKVGGSIDKSELQRLYDLLKEKDLAAYTEDSARMFTDALREAERLLAGDAQTAEIQKKITESVEALKAADNGLELNASEMNKIVKEAERAIEAAEEAERRAQAAQAEAERAKKEAEAAKANSALTKAEVDSAKAEAAKLQKAAEEARSQAKSAMETAQEIAGTDMGIARISLNNASYNRIVVSWAGKKGVDGYEIYRSSSKKGAYTLIKTVGADATKYTDSKRICGKIYYYKMRAYKDTAVGRIYGAYSAVGQLKAAPEKAVISKAAAGSKSASVTIRKQDGVTGYIIYRSSNKKSGYKKVKTVKASASRTWKDGKLKSGKVYYYKVRAYKTVKGKKVYGAYSAAKQVKIK